jgi:hypothetical protein
MSTMLGIYGGSSQAARGGHLGLLQWVCAQGCLWDRNMCSQAVQGGHLDLLKWA